MWPSVTNIVLGAMLIVISFVGSMAGSISQAFLWTLVLMGAVVMGVALWGVADYMGQHNLSAKQLEDGL